MKRLTRELERAVRFDEAARLVREAAVRLGLGTCQVISGTVDGELTMPVISHEGWFATLVFEPIDAARQRELAILAMYLSVWCTGRAISNTPSTSLTPRQAEIAELAALGHRNAEIASALGISVNTVKARLKDVFERLGVCNRTELVSSLRRASYALPVAR